ncbi:MAG: SpvB/TcaC N-terminal domain-containing protein, partial [Spirochaetales bacterium]|nr:SpvB/TcaC N-terminal domain-containing protein [Spirochaetales bacterium]
MKKSYRTVESKNRRLAYFTLIFYLFSISPMAYALPGESQSIPSPQFELIQEQNEVFTYELTPYEDALIVYGDVELEIPAGAVDKNVTLTIEKLDGVRRLNDGMNNVTRDAAGYRFGPHPITFNKNIRVTLPYDQSVNESDTSLADLKMWFFNDNHSSWEGLPADSVDTERSVITSLTNHFTDMITSTLTLPESPGPINFDPNSIKELEAADPGSIVPQVKGLEPGSMGGASFSLPFRLPPGRGQATPQLALSYNINSANSWMGKGFDVSVPSITTDTRFGLPEYDGNDTYMLAGQKLVLDPSMNTDVYKEYVLEQEGSFQRIARKIEDDEDWWEVTSKDGTLTIYGTGNAWTGKSASEVFTWYIKATVDRNGNRVDYSYQQSQGYTYPESISWTGYEGEEAPYTLIFNRGSRDDIRSDARGGYMSRLTDRLNSLEIQYYGETFRIYEFSYRYNLFGQSELTAYDECDGSGNIDESAYRFEFAYEELEEVDGGYQGFEKDLEIWGAGVSRPLSKNSTLSAGVSLYTGVSISIIVPKIFGLKQVNVASFGISTGGGYNRMWDSSSLMDVDGNGLPDVTWQKGSSLYYYPNTGTDLNSSSSSFSGASYVMNEGEQTSFNIGASGGAGGVSVSASKDYSWSYGISTFSDINGDGFIDMVKRNKSSFLMNSGTGFSSEGWGSVSPQETAAVDPSVIADFENGYYIEEPVRKWKAWKAGSVTVENTIRLAQDELRSDDGVQAILDYPDREAIPLIISDSTIAEETEHQVEVSNDDPLYFALDTLGEIKDSGAGENENCFADDLIWNTRISYDSINLFDDVKDLEPYYYLQDDLILWDFDDLPDYIKTYYIENKDLEDGSYIYSYKLGDIKTIFNNQTPSDRTLVRNWQVDNNLFIPRNIPRSIYDKLYESLKNIEDLKDDEDKDHTALLSLVMLYDYQNETDSFRLDDDTLSNSLFLNSLKKIMPAGSSALSSEEKSRIGHYYLLDRQLVWTETSNPVNEYTRKSNMSDSILYSNLDKTTASLGRGSADGLYLVDKTASDDGTIYTVLDRINKTVYLYSGSTIDSPDLTVSGNSYSFTYEGIKRKYNLTYNTYPEQIPSESYENVVLPLVLADENIGIAPLAELKADYLDALITDIDNAIALIDEQIGADPPPGEDELLSLEAEKVPLVALRTLYTDNYTLSASGTYLLSDSVSDDDYLSLIESFQDDFAQQADSELYTFSGSNDDEALYLAFISDENQALFESYCGITVSDLLTLVDGSKTPNPAAAADSSLLADLEYYRATVELFPYYTKGEGVYTVNELTEAEKSTVASRMSTANLKALSSIKRSYFYTGSDIYPVYKETISESQDALSINQLDGTSIEAQAGDTYSYINYLCFEGSNSVIEKIYFPMFNSLSDFKAEELSGIDVEEYNFEDDYILVFSDDFEDEMEDYVEKKTTPDGEYFSGGNRNWYYGFWSAVHDWNPSRIGSDYYTDDPSYDESSLDSVETATPPFLVGASLNTKEDDDPYYEGIDEIVLSKNTWLGTSSTYSTSYVELSDTGAEPVYEENYFTPYFDSSDRMHPMRKGGLKYYTSPVAQTSTSGGGSSLEDFRYSRSEGTSVTGGINVVANFTGGKGKSKTYTTRDLRDMDGDRIPDLISADNSGHISVVKGTGAGFGYSFNIDNSFSYLSRSVSESYNCGASLSAGGQKSVQDPSGKKLFEIVDPEPPKGLNASFSPGINGGYSTTNTVIDLADINGDGLADHITRSGDGDLYVRYNYGGKFTSNNRFPTAF